MSFDRVPTPIRADIPSVHSLRNKVGRLLWGAVWVTLFRPSPKILHGWRRALLRLFGARLGVGVNCHPSVRVWAPWNLTMRDHSSMGAYVDCYSVDQIVLGEQSTVSQYSFLCSASHDISDPQLSLITAPIRIGAGAWVAADVFVGPGVTVGEGAVIGARSSVYRDVPAWTVVGGNPAHVIRVRELREH